jgi:hypothetical protein
MSNYSKRIREERHACYEIALGDAHIAAARAQVGMQEGRGLDCGFAWAVVHDTAFNAWCRKRAREVAASLNVAGNRAYYGSKHHAAGWCFWNPGGYPGQSIGIKEAGAHAFRDSLAHALQIRVETGSRLD